MSDPEKIKRKRTTFAWLARFLGLRQKKGPMKTSSSSFVSSTPTTPTDPVYFGVSPQKIYEDESLLVNGIPQVLWYTAEALEPWMIIEGVFRVSGIFSEMNRMKATFEEGKLPDFPKVDSKHSISGLLEKWFRDLPEPITTYGLYNDFMKIVDDLPDSVRLEVAQKAVAKLPPHNIQILGFFLRVLRKVAALEHENKMGARNLGVVFGSILLGSNTLEISLGMKQVLNNQSSVVEYLINNCIPLFPRDDDPEEVAEIGHSSSSSSSSSSPSEEAEVKATEGEGEGEGEGKGGED